jgi:hypothetical protein
MIELEEEEEKKEKPENTLLTSVKNTGVFTGHLLRDAWKDTKEFKEWYNLPHNIGAIGAKGIESFFTIDTDNPKEVALELIQKVGNPRKGLAGEIISEVPGVKQAINQLDEITQPIRTNIRTALTGNRLQPIYETIGVQPNRGLLQQGVDNRLGQNVFASEQLYDPSVTKVSRDKGGAFSTGHRGLANISYADNIGLKRKFTKLHQLQTQSPFKHHHIEDIAFTGKWMNTSDYKEVVKELNKIKIYPGDSPTNIIGMMDEGNRFLQTGKTDLIRNLKKQNFPGLENIDNYGQLTSPKANQEVRRLVDDLFKSPEYSDDFFQGSIDKLGRKTDNQIEAMFETLPDGTRVSPTLPKDTISFPTWERLGLDINTKEFLSLPKKQQNLLKKQAWAKRWETLGVNRKNIKYDPTKMILSKDHIDTIHYNVYNSPKFKEKVELIKMIDDGSYYKLTAAQKAEKIAEVYKIQKNTSINVAKKRLKLIKNFLKKSEPIRYRDIYSKDPTKLRQWIIDNPSISANLGWKDELLDYKTLTKDPGKVTSEFKTVFSTLVQ